MSTETVSMPAGSIVITPTQMYSELRDVSDGLKKLVNLVDPSLTTIRDDVTDHEGRIRVLERKVYAVGAAAAAVGAIIARGIAFFS